MPNSLLDRATLRRDLGGRCRRELSSLVCASLSGDEKRSSRTLDQQACSALSWLAVLALALVVQTAPTSRIRQR